MTFDREQGIAQDVGKFWARNAEIGKVTVVSISLDDEQTVDFSFNGMNLVIPIERLKRFCWRAKE